MIFVFFNDNNDFKVVIFLIILLGHFIKVFTVFNFIIQIKFMIFLVIIIIAITSMVVVVVVVIVVVVMKK